MQVPKRPAAGPARAFREMRIPLAARGQLWASTGPTSWRGTELIVAFGLSQSRSTSARCCSEAFSAGAAVAILVSVSASMDRNATARVTSGFSR